MRHPYQRSLCVAADIAAYGSLNEPDQAWAQDRFVAVLDGAAAAAGLDRARWHRQTVGDADLAVIPAGPHEPDVVDAFTREIAVGLFRENDRRPRDARLRLRVAVDAGPVVRSTTGFLGQAVISVARLVDSTLLHRALDLAPDAGLAVLLSDRVYRDVVASGYTALPTAAFRPVRVTEKEFSEPAWLRVPGADVHGLPLDGPVIRLAR